VQDFEGVAVNYPDYSSGEAGSQSNQWKQQDENNT
jgi:hypothetical protein